MEAIWKRVLPTRLFVGLWDFCALRELAFLRQITQGSWLTTRRRGRDQPRRALRLRHQPIRPAGQRHQQQHPQPEPDSGPRRPAGRERPGDPGRRGLQHSLILTSTGQLYAFGSNDYGELGREANEQPNPTPTTIALPGASGPVTQIGASVPLIEGRPACRLARRAVPLYPGDAPPVIPAAWLEPLRLVVAA
jgi:Regulator of chromosome condensation (RCC1) repeat